MGFLLAVGLTFLICYFIESLTPYWVFIFFFYWVISAWIVGKLKQWIEIKKYKLKLHAIEQRIHALNFQKVSNTINAIEKARDRFEEKLIDGGFIRKNQNISINKYLTAYHNFKKGNKKTSKKYRSRYY